MRAAGGERDVRARGRLDDNDQIKVARGVRISRSMVHRAPPNVLELGIFGKREIENRCPCQASGLTSAGLGNLLLATLAFISYRAVASLTGRPVLVRIQLPSSVAASRPAKHGDPSECSPDESPPAFGAVAHKSASFLASVTPRVLEREGTAQLRLPDDIRLCDIVCSNGRVRDEALRGEGDDRRVTAPARRLRPRRRRESPRFAIPWCADCPARRRGRHRTRSGGRAAPEQG
jgi:hypothetical protein